MDNQTKLIRQTISLMAEQLAASVVKLVSSMTLAELSKLAEGNTTRAAKSAAKPATKAKPAPAKPATKKPAKAEPAKKAKPAASPKAKITTEVGTNAVLNAIATHKGPMKATEVLAGVTLDPKPSVEQLGRYLRDLVARGLVTKRGNTKATEYEITESGRAQSAR